MKAEKSRLRGEIRARIAALDPDYISKSDTGIMRNTLKMPGFRSAHTAVSYTHLDVYKRQLRSAGTEPAEDL